METERDLLSNPLILVALEVELPINKFSEFNLKYTGVGKINAAMSTCINIQKYQPSCIINFGSAGSLDKTISGLVAVDKVYQRDMDVRGLGFELGITPFEDNASEIKLSVDSNLNKNDMVPMASCSTGDNFVSSFPELVSQIVDMELYAIAKVCLNFKIPLFSWKFISDSADSNSPEEWEKNVTRGYSIFDEIVLSKIRHHIKS